MPVWRFVLQYFIVLFFKSIDFDRILERQLKDLVFCSGHVNETFYVSVIMLISHAVRVIRWISLKCKVHELGMYVIFDSYDDDESVDVKLSCYLCNIVSYRSIQMTFLCYMHQLVFLSIRVVPLWKYIYLK